MKNLFKELKITNSVKILIYIGVAFILIGGSSFAYLNFFIQGNETNLVSAGCLEVTFSEKNNINLDNAVPISDVDGKKELPYTFTLTNSCDLEAYYETTFNVLNSSGNENESKVKLYLTGDNYFEPSFISNFRTTELIEKPSDVRTSYLIDSGYLKQGESKTFNLRMWIDYDVTNFDGSLDNKIIVTSIADKGPNFSENTTGYQILGRYGITSSSVINPNYSVSSPSDGQTSGLYKTQGIDDSYTYYFRGNVNNYFKFGKYATDVTYPYNTQNMRSHSAGDDIIWRIVRINEDGSVKLILDDLIGYQSFNQTGGMTYYENSSIKTTIDNWYNTHLSNYDSYITNTKFCINKTYKMINNVNYYSSYINIINNATPTLTCDSDNVYVSKIGLLSGEELSMAGNAYNNLSANNYLYLNDTGGWYTLTPASINNGTIANIASIYKKSLDITSISTVLGVRPVISIDSNYLLSGDGSKTNPYQISGVRYETKVLTIDTNGGTYNGVTSAKYNLIAGERITLEVPTRKNYEFTGWTIESGDGEITDNNIFTMGSSATLIKANWKEATKVLTINLNGGTYNGDTTMNVVKGSTITLTAPTKTDYTFAGWEATGSGTTTTGDTVTMGTEDSSITAKWVQTVTEISYTGVDPETAYEAIPGSYILEVYGASGGGYDVGTGGLGGYSKGTLTLTNNTSLYVFVGGEGLTNSSSGWGMVSGGYNGGGNSGFRGYCGSGGGATDIRINGTTLYSRVIVAGAGGGGAYDSSSKYGTGGAGGETGGTGINSNSTTTLCGTGGTISSGGNPGNQTGSGTAGSFGLGGAAAYASSANDIAGGGGAGWYGGGGAGYYSTNAKSICGGGGGSSYVYTSTTASYYPAGGLLNSSYYLTNTSMTTGVHSGNGKAIITVSSISY